MFAVVSSPAPWDAEPEELVRVALEAGAVGIGHAEQLADHLRGNRLCQRRDQVRRLVERGHRVEVLVRDGVDLVGQRSRTPRPVIDDDAPYQAWSNSTRTMALWAASARRGAELFGTDTPAGARLRRTSQFFELMHQDMTLAAEHYRQALR